MNLPSGRRQILNFLLPGDVISLGSIFERKVHYSVKALTDVQISEMQRVEVQSRLFGHPSVGRVLADLCSEREQESDSRLAALGHGSAEERIAHLLLQLVMRIAAHNVIRENTYPIPLRQQHVADAVGLTSVHVSRVLGSFRERGVLSLSGGKLDVFDMPELERMAGTLVRYPAS